MGECWWGSISIEEEIETTCYTDNGNVLTGEVVLDDVAQSVDYQRSYRIRK